MSLRVQIEGVECLRLLNEIIADFDEVQRGPDIPLSHHQCEWRHQEP